MWSQESVDRFDHKIPGKISSALNINPYIDWLIGYNLIPNGRYTMRMIDQSNTSCFVLKSLLCEFTEATACK